MILDQGEHLTPDVMPEQLVDLDELTGGEITPTNTTGLDAVDEQLIAQLAGHPVPSRRRAAART